MTRSHGRHGDGSGGHRDAADPMTHPDPLRAADAAQRMAVEGLDDDDNSFFANTITLTVRRAALAVRLYEDRNKNDAVSLEHLLKFFSDPDYQGEVLGISKEDAQARWSMNAYWLDDDTRFFFEHVYYGTWGAQIRDQNATTAALALTAAKLR